MRYLGVIWLPSENVNITTIDAADISQAAEALRSICRREYPESVRAVLAPQSFCTPIDLSRED